MCGRSLTFKGVLLIYFLSIEIYGLAQSLPVGYPILEEFSRRSQLESTRVGSSFLIRPVVKLDSVDSSIGGHLINSKLASFRFLPFLNTTRFSSKRPYGWGDYGMIPNPGIQTYFSGGIHIRFSILNIDFVSFPENWAIQKFTFLPISEGK